MLHPIAPEVDINFYGPQAKENAGLDSDMRMDHALNRSYLMYSLIIKVPYRVMHMLLTGNWSRMLIRTS